MLMMIHFSVLKYENDTFRRLTGGMIRNTMGPLLKIAAKITKIILISTHKTVEYTVKQFVHRGAADSAISSRSDRLTKSQ